MRIAPHRGPGGGQFADQAARAHEHQAGHAAQDADRDARHARRDAAVGDYYDTQGPRRSS